MCICTKQPLYSIYVTLYLVEVKYFEARSGSFPSMLQIFDNSWIKKWSSEHALSSLTVTSVISVFKTHLNFVCLFVYGFKPSLAIDSFLEFSFDFWMKKMSVVKLLFVLFFYPLMIYFHFVFKIYECIVN